MISHELRQLLKATPFQPFRIHLADGRHFDVPHPDFMMVFHKEPMAILEKEDGVSERINLPIVISVETLPETHVA